MMQENQETSRAILQIFQHHYDVPHMWSLVFPYKDISPIAYFDESQWFDCSADYTYVGNVRLLLTMPKASSQENLILCLSRIILLRPFGLSSIFGEIESNDITQGP